MLYTRHSQLELAYLFLMGMSMMCVTKPTLKHFTVGVTTAQELIVSSERQWAAFLHELVLARCSWVMIIWNTRKETCLLHNKFDWFRPKWWWLVNKTYGRYSVCSATWPYEKRGGYERTQHPHNHISACTNTSIIPVEMMQRKVTYHPLTPVWGQNAKQVEVVMQQAKTWSSFKIYFRQLTIVLTTLQNAQVDGSSFSTTVKASAEACIAVFRLLW